MPERPGLVPEGPLGVAFDLGTTTLVGALVDIPSGRVLEVVSRANPQREWGPDLVSRVDAAADPGVRGELTDTLRRACDDIIGELAGARARDVARIAAAGNSVMEHLFLGLAVDTFARVPYRPLFREARELAARDAGLASAPDAGLYVFPLVGGFVGGDAVAVISALGLGRKGGGGTALAIDIGTNSEIILSSGGLIYATSSAAGPAFEGGNISRGMAAGPGAIAGVDFDGDSVRIDVIGGARPGGICGSGLIDAVSGLVRAGVIDRSGRIRDPDEVETNLSVRISPGEDGNAFVLHRDARGTVAITQEDVRSLQTAKAAIRAGVDVLLAKAGLDAGDVDRVYLAGAFGANIDKGSLAGIGVIDREWLPVTGFTGDAALDGVVKTLADEEDRKEAERAAGAAKYVPLSGSRRFEDGFIRAMDF